MDFFNIGGGELLVIILLALVLFRPEDIYKAMRTLGRYTRSARRMWAEFSTNIKQEMETREVEEALSETKALIGSAEEAVATLKTSVNDVTKTVESDVSTAGKSLKSQAAESAAALKAETASIATAELDSAAAALKDAESAIDVVADAVEAGDALIAPEWTEADPNVSLADRVPDELPDEVPAP